MKIMDPLFKCSIISGAKDAVIQALLKKFYYLNLPDAQGYTPLMLAAENGHYDICQLLLQCGADCTLRNIDGRTAAYLAAYAGHKKIVALFPSYLLEGTKFAKKRRVRRSSKQMGIKVGKIPKHTTAKSTFSPSTADAEETIFAEGVCMTTSNDSVSSDADILHQAPIESMPFADSPTRDIEAEEVRPKVRRPRPNRCRQETQLPFPHEDKDNSLCPGNSLMASEG